MGIVGYIFIYLLIKKGLCNIKNNETIPLIIMMLSYGIMESILIRPECLLSIYFWYIIINKSGVIKLEKEQC